MPKLSVGDKAHRVVDFLMGLSNWQVQRALAPHGFSQKVLDEGWARLQRLTSDRLQLSSTLVDPRLLGALDAWENRWYPIIEVVLRTNFPDVHAKVFQNLSQTEGSEVLLSVRTLLDRLETIEKPADEGGLGKKGRDARKLLEERGAGERTFSEARELIAQIGSIAEPPPGSIDAEAAKAAEEGLWSWYLEWSGIARVAIRDRRMLRALGFLRTVRKPSGEEEDVVVPDEDVATDPQPAPADPTPPAA